MQGRVLFWGSRRAFPRARARRARPLRRNGVRLRTVREARCRYIKNFMPEVPFLAKNDFKGRSYPAWSLIKKLGAERGLTDWQKSFYLAPRMPDQELFNVQADPRCMNNLAASDEPGHQATLKRLRAELEKCPIEADDKGRFPEPPEVTVARGATRKGAASGPDSGAKPRKRNKQAK